MPDSYTRANARGETRFVLAEIRPFRGIRYNDERYAELSAVLAPPYDVISPSEHKELLARSDRNVVRLILPEPSPGGASKNKYAAAAQYLEDWLNDETLIQDRVPAVYLLDQQFESNGERKLRRAVIVRVRAEPFGRGAVLPHEDTMPGPKADRLELMNATRMNMCQVFGLYPDDGAAAAVIAQMAEIDPVAEGTGIDGVRNTVRVVYHTKLIAELAALLREKRIVVADGHHRYETAVAYRDQRRAERGIVTYEEPFEFVSMALVATTDPGLSIRPTHRLVKGLIGFAPDGLFQRAAADFNIEEVASDARAILTRLGERADRHAFGIVTAAGSRIFTRNTGTRTADGSVENLDTHILHHRVFHQLLGLGPDAWAKGGPVDYVQSPDECVASVLGGRSQLAAILNPTRIDEVIAVALAGGRMPPKSTFFYPKLPTGIVINPLI